MAARGGQILNTIYKGYPSWYGKLTTKVTIDPKGEVHETDRKNNTFKTVISVNKN
jgi:hypothetical protein